MVDFSPLVNGVDVTSVSSAIIALGVLAIAPNVVRWAVNKLVSFFDFEDDDMPRDLNDDFWDKVESGEIPRKDWME